MKRSLLAVLLLLSPAALRVSSALAPARPGAVELKELRRQAHKLAELLRREDLEEEEEVSAADFAGEKKQQGEASGQAAEKLLGRLARLEADPALGPGLGRLIAQVEDVLRSMPERWYGAAHPAGLTRALARELDEDAKTAPDAAALASTLQGRLKLPADAEGLPRDLAVDDFLKAGPIVIFLCKNRRGEPSAYLAVDPGHLKRDGYHVGIGAKMRGKVSGAHLSPDGDYNFFLYGIFNEIKPQDLHNDGMYLPQDGDVVESEGWTYYDEFHKDELEPEKKLSAGRETLWEIHPVTRVTLIQKAAKK